MRREKQFFVRSWLRPHALAADNSDCFHLSTMAATSLCAAAAASWGVASSCTTLANIRGITKVLNTSIHAGLASHGAPRLGVQCNASRSAKYLFGGSEKGSLSRRTTKFGSAFGYAGKLQPRLLS